DQLLGELLARIGAEEVRGVQHPGGHDLLDRVGYRGVAITERVDGDTADEVQDLPAALHDEPAAMPRNDRGAHGTIDSQQRAAHTSASSRCGTATSLPAGVRRVPASSSVNR